MFIDIHMHTRKTIGFPRKWDGQTYATPSQVLEKYATLDIESGVILPGVNPECSRAAQSNEEVLEICDMFPGRFIPFCNIDPRAISNSPDAPLDEILEFYKQKGCKGVGEVCANLAFDDPMVQNLFACCEMTGLPLTFHIADKIGGTYGLFDDPGLPRLQASLEKFSDLIFMGHSQAFWSEIGPVQPDKRSTYPEGAIESPGRVVELMRKHGNLHGDLSAGSGYNAMHRDESFGIEFMNEFQDRLYFGTDLTSPSQSPALGHYLTSLRESGKLSESVFNKIARENAVRLFGL